MSQVSRTPPPRPAIDIEDRALGAMLGLAIGDALGMPTQSMRRQDILADYGRITGLVAAGPRQQIASGMPAGAITDDTEQAMLLARLLIEGDGHLDPVVFAEALMRWEREMEAKGSLDLLGPSTRRALERIAAGIPADEAGKYGATNGAAMRIAPVGLSVSPEPLDRLVDAVVQASRITHNTSNGLAAAAAVGAAVSAGVEGGTAEHSIAVAIEAANLAAERGHWRAGGHIGPRIAWAVRHMKRLDPQDWAYELDAVVGTDLLAQESVVAAFAIFAVAPTAWDAVCLAASLGGDTDTIGAIAGSIAGAHGGASVWPAEVVQRVQDVNMIDFGPLVAGLLRIRRNGPQPNSGPASIPSWPSAD